MPGARRWAALYKDLGTDPISAEPCRSSEYFALERERIFSRVWLNVGRADEIPRAGDYFVREIPIASASIVVARGDDGAIRAFHNVCSHRSNKVSWDESGNCRRFTCNFHGWVFGLNGELRGVPDEAQFHELDKRANGLTLVALDEWQGFLFVNLDPKPQWTLAEYLGDLGQGLNGWPFGDRTTCYRYKVEVQANWKVAMNAFQESYHVPFVHRKSVPDSAAGPENPYAHLVGLALHPLHSVISIYSNPKTRTNAIDDVVARHGPGYRKREVTLPSLPRGVNPMKSNQWGFDIDTIFPNFMMLLWGNGMYTTYNFWPVAFNRTLFEIRLYNRNPQKAGEKFAHEYNRVVLRSAIAEDLATMERIQPMIESGAKRKFLLQDNEIAIRHHYKVVDQFVRSGMS
jgi:phenylpropionate dioxygenase-like ring-hydroxylating dioxygenase large terminal subunit